MFFSQIFKASFLLFFRRKNVKNLTKFFLKNETYFQIEFLSFGYLLKFLSKAWTVFRRPILVANLQLDNKSLSDSRMSNALSFFKQKNRKPHQLDEVIKKFKILQ